MRLATSGPMPSGRIGGRGRRLVNSSELSSATFKYFHLNLSSGAGNGRPGVRKRPGHRIVTWLILPVVICLSQRLSHACLSISNLYSETANGSLNQLSFI